MREPFDLATVLIEAITPDGKWQEELRRALSAPVPRPALPTAEASPTNPPAPEIASVPLPAAEPSVVYPLRAATEVDIGTQASVDMAQPEPEVGIIPTVAPHRPWRPPRLALSVLALLLILASFAGLAAANGRGLFPVGRANRGPTTTATFAGTATPFPTATPQPTATATPPTGFMWVTDAYLSAGSSARYRFLVPTTWHSTLFQNPGLQGGTVYSVRVDPPKGTNDGDILTGRITKAPTTDQHLLNYMSFGDPNTSYSGTKLHITAGNVSWQGLETHITQPNGVSFYTIVYVCHHNGDGYSIEFQGKDTLFSQYNQQAYTSMLRSFQFLS